VSVTVIAVQAAADAAPSAMVSVIGLDSDKVAALCDAANKEVSEDERVQIANFLCPGNYAVSGGVKGVEAVEAKAKSFKARMTVNILTFFSLSGCNQTMATV
jgi:[acyl-carrier-protein] S-malonyltransferase